MRHKYFGFIVLFILTFFHIFQFPSIVYGEKLNDNSFLIEEGYNQEENVIQHIFNCSFSQSNNLSFSYTEEWPLLRQTSQISATFNWNDYLGETLLNYRYQLILDDTVALAPRISLVLPTADKKYSTTEIGWGVEINLPLSLNISDRFAVHLNSGTRYDIKSKNYQFNIGGSYIFVIIDNLEFLNEYLMKIGEKEEIQMVSGIGLRAGLNLKKDFQVVPGLGLYRDFGDKENFFFIYLSAEHSI